MKFIAKNILNRMSFKCSENHQSTTPKSKGGCINDLPKNPSREICPLKNSALRKLFDAYAIGDARVCYLSCDVIIVNGHGFNFLQTGRHIRSTRQLN
jgi:hypothetical protein